MFGDNFLGAVRAATEAARIDAIERSVDGFEKILGLRLFQERFYGKRSARAVSAIHNTQLQVVLVSGWNQAQVQSVATLFQSSPESLKESLFHSQV